jgi:DNA-binding protein HU-beta
MQLKKALFGALFFRVESIVYVNFHIMNLVRYDIFLTCSTECNRPQNRLTQGFAACLIPAADFLRRIAVLPITSNKRHYGHQPLLGGIILNKTELIDHIAGSADISKAAASRALDALIGAVTTTLKKNGTVTLVGFGTFAVGKRAARTGRNPRTGEAIKIKAAKVPKFKPGKALKDAVN